MEPRNASPAISEPHSCKHCQKLILHLPERYRRENEVGIGNLDQSWIPSRALLWLESLGLGVPTGYYCIFDITIAEMRQAALQGCSLFNLLLKDSAADIPGALFLAGFFAVDDTIVDFRVLSQESERRGKTSLIPLLARGEDQELYFTICADAGNSASREVFGRPINRFPSSEQSLESARDWLHSCLMTHDICPKPNGKFMPRRLIAISNVGESDHLSLLECSDPEPYAALSYCWGNKKQITTTTTNLQRHRNVLSIKDLPATVKDAITVASKLGIRRLWIDCLCIIQDDDDDKAREIAKMPLIYSQATVMIAASHANSVHEGFLTDRMPHAEFELPYRCRNGEAGLITLRPEMGRYGERRQPLESRGWAFQERLLSPRILDYRSHHTEWVCQENKGDRRLTDGNSDIKDSNYGSNNFYPYISDDLSVFLAAILQKGHTPSANSTSLTAEKNPIDKYLQIWYELVERYTLRDLTISSDRILAISAIADRFRPLVIDEYCAGHWKSSLNKELLWKSCESIESDEPVRMLKPRPSEYQAPSWSWASISVPIIASLFMNTRGRGRVDYFEGQIDDCFQILDCQIQLRREEKSESMDVYQFGAVRSGTLVVKGRMREAELWCALSDYNEELEYTIVRYLSSQGATLDSVHIHLDALEDEFVDTLENFIPVYILRVAQKRYPTGLILRQKGPSTYSRLGIVEFKFKYFDNQRLSEEAQEELCWLNAGEIRTITIV